MVRRSFINGLKGPGLAIVAILFLQYFEESPLRAYTPFPVSLLVVIVIYSVFQSGRLAGFISAFLTMIYFYYFLVITQGFVHDPADAWNRLISWGVALPIIVAFVGVLKRRSLNLATDRERDRSLQEITEVNQRTEMVLENVMGIIWAVDLNGMFTLSQGFGLKTVGLRSGERIGSSVFDAYPSNHVVIIATRKAMLGEKSSATFQIKDIWLECNLSPTRDKFGAITGAVGVATDVTARIDSESAKAQLLAMEQAAKQVRESEAKFKGAFENSPIGIGLSRPDGVWFDVNPAFCQMLGYKKTELLGKTISDITFIGDQNIGSEMREKMLKGEVEYVSFEKRYVHKQGHAISFWINGSLIRDAAGEPLYILGQMVDVTERRRSEKELRDTTLKLQTLINTSPVAIIALDKDQKVTLWNPACEKMFGWTASEAIGSEMPFVQSAKRSESKKIIEIINATREAVHFESDRVTKSGVFIKTATAAIPLVDEKHKVTGLMAVMMDNTERFRAQEKLIETNSALRIATQAKSEFLANMSHEIRTPINGVMGMSNLLLDMELGTEQKDCAQTIRSSAEILLNLVNDILDFSKIEAGKFTLESINFDLEQVTHNIEQLLSLSAKQKGLRLTRVLDPQLLNTFYKGDPTRIGQILSNLIGNAIKFTESGNISVVISADHSVLEGVDDQLTHLKVEVTDTGIGLADSALARMFQPFTQADASTNRRFGGTGLGLSICKNLVELMGGEIGVTSTEGKGSTFWFTLVLQKETKQVSILENKPSAILLARAGKPIRILLAEDNPVNQKIAVRMLEKSGFHVDAVANGAEAVTAANTVPYDLVLMDCQMPEMDGYQATGEIRLSSNPKVSSLPIVAMTANALSGDRQKCLEAGMNDYVTKPVKVQDLIEVIYKNLPDQFAA